MTLIDPTATLAGESNLVPGSGHACPLVARHVALRLNLSVRVLAKRIGISVGAMQTLLSTDKWPKRADRADMQERIREAFAEAGATPAELADLFIRYARRKSPRAPDQSSTHHQEEFMQPPKQSLTPEARKAFELFNNPFDGEVTDAREMFYTGEIRYIREACWQTAVNAKCVAITGESGAGKTTALADLKDRIESERQPVIMIEPFSILGMDENDTRGKTLKSADIQTAIAMTLDPLTPVAQTSERRTRQIHELLTQSTRGGHMHVLVLEEAHKMPVAAISQLKRLHERMRLGHKPMLGILLLGHPELRIKLRRHDVREFAQRCEQVELRPLDGALQPYLAHKAKLAGKALEALITPDGVEEMRARMTVHRPGDKTVVSMLYPLAVNNVMTAALNLAAELGAPVVDRDVMRAVSW